MTPADLPPITEGAAVAMMIVAFIAGVLVGRVLR